MGSDLKKHKVSDENVITSSICFESFTVSFFLALLRNSKSRVTCTNEILKKMCCSRFPSPKSDARETGSWQTCGEQR